MGAFCCGGLGFVCLRISHKREVLISEAVFQSSINLPFFIESRETWHVLTGRNTCLPMPCVLPGVSAGFPGCSQKPLPLNLTCHSLTDLLQALSLYWLVTESQYPARETWCKHEPTGNSCLTARMLREGGLLERRGEGIPVCP